MKSAIAKKGQVIISKKKDNHMSPEKRTFASCLSDGGKNRKGTARTEGRKRRFPPEGLGGEGRASRLQRKGIPMATLQKKFHEGPEGRGGPFVQEKQTYCDRTDRPDGRVPRKVRRSRHHRDEEKRQSRNHDSGERGGGGGVVLVGWGGGGGGGGGVSGGEDLFPPPLSFFKDGNHEEIFAEKKKKKTKWRLSRHSRGGKSGAVMTIREDIF